MNLQQIIENYPEQEFLKADGFDECILGVEEITGRLIYSVSECINVIHKEQNMDYEEAAEYFEFNVSGSYMGEQTPIWCYTGIY